MDADVVKMSIEKVHTQMPDSLAVLSWLWKQFAQSVYELVCAKFGKHIPELTPPAAKRLSEITFQHILKRLKSIDGVHPRYHECLEALVQIETQARFDRLFSATHIVDLKKKSVSLSCCLVLKRYFGSIRKLLLRHKKLDDACQWSWFMTEILHRLFVV